MNQLWGESIDIYSYWQRNVYPNRKKKLFLKRNKNFSRKQIKAIKEAANLLLIEKTDLVGIEDVKKTFPTLSFAQVKQILSQFRPEE